MAVNVDLIRATMKLIEENPENWDQNHFIWIPEGEPICHTTLCFAAFALAAKMGPARFFDTYLERDGWSRGWSEAGTDIEMAAIRALGLSCEQAGEIFYTMEDDLDAFKAVVTGVTGVTFDEQDS